MQCISSDRVLLPSRRQKFVERGKKKNANETYQWIIQKGDTYKNCVFRIARRIFLPRTSHTYTSAQWEIVYCIFVCASLQIHSKRQRAKQTTHQREREAVITFGDQ